MVDDYRSVQDGARVHRHKRGSSNPGSGQLLRQPFPGASHQIFVTEAPVVAVMPEVADNSFARGFDDVFARRLGVNWPDENKAVYWHRELPTRLQSRRQAR